MYCYFGDLDFWLAMQGGLKMLSIRLDSIESTQIISPFVDSSSRFVRHDPMRIELRRNPHMFPSMSKTRKLSRFVWGTLRLESICTQSCLTQIDFRYDKSTTGVTIRVDSIESSRIDNIFNPPCIVHRKSKSMK